MTADGAAAGVLAQTNWAALAEQKAFLLRAIADAEKRGQRTGYPYAQTAQALSGLLHWVDELQDAAHADGHPVVFLTADT